MVERSYPPESPLARLDSGRKAAAAGRYEEALRAYRWFHEQALALQPEVYGVRLSFALGYWVELGQHYPAALNQLRSVRDRKTAELQRGRGARGLFHDVIAIHRELGESERDHPLFCHLLEHHAELAHECADLALPAIVAAGDFELAARFLPESSSCIRRAAAQLLADVADLRQRCGPGGRSPRAPLDRLLEVAAGFYVEELRQHLTVLRATGRGSDAEALRDLALELVAADAIQTDVRRLLE